MAAAAEHPAAHLDVRARLRMSEPLSGPIDLASPWAGLDRRLRAELERLRAAGGEPPDRFRGLYILEEEVAGHLAGAPAERFPLLHLDRLGRLCDELGLDAFETSVLLACLAPDLDPAYERVYGYLQDDIARRRPEVGLLLRLFCREPAEMAAAVGSLHPDAPLLRGGLLHLPGAGDRPLLARTPRADDRVVGHLLGGDGIDARLLACARHEPEPRPRLLHESAVDVVLRAAGTGA